MDVPDASRSRPDVYCGYSTPARSGTCCRKTIRTTNPFIGAFKPGATMKFCASVDGCSQRASRDKGGLDEAECFIDATFVMAKGGGSGIGSTKRGKGMKIMAIVDRHGLPLSVSMHAANHHEVRLVQLCFRQRRILVRWEYYAQNFLGFVQLACLVVLFRRFQIGSNLSRR
jgi:hypothetical protein